MSWFDTLLGYGEDIAGSALGKAAIGAGVGALAGSQDQKNSATTEVNMPDNYRQGYDRLLEMTNQQVNTPFQARETARVEVPTNAYDALFSNPEMLQLQRQSDNQYAAANAPQPMMQQPMQQPAANMQPMMQEAPNMQQGGNAPLPLNDMGDGRYMSKSGIMLSGENAKAAAEAEAMQALFGTPQNGTSWASTAFAGGDNTGSNQFTGAEWDKNAALQALMAGDKSGYMEQAGRKMYDPRVSGFGKYLEMAKPFIVGAALAPIGGAFGGAIGGATGSAAAGSLGKLAANRALGGAFNG
jgi:hypothetical protein